MNDLAISLDPERRPIEAVTTIPWSVLEAYEAVAKAAAAVVAGVEIGPSDATPLEELGEALDVLHQIVVPVTDPNRPAPNGPAAERAAP